jgi:beta-glucanase (GH16 family)
VNRSLKYPSIGAIFVLSIMLTACGNSHEAEEISAAPAAAPLVPGGQRNAGFTNNDSIVHAINVGGPAYQGADGIVYAGDTLATQAEKGEIGKIDGAQDPEIYRTYRRGEVSIGLPVDNGRYDLTLMFAEPDKVPVGSRIFDVYAEGRAIVADLDVRKARDGRIRSALVHTVTGIEVSDGQLDLDLRASKAEPVLGALIVRGQHEDPREWELVWSDEFDYEGAPDPVRWNYDIWPARKVNSEDQAYTDRPQNVRVENGTLVIEAHKESYDDAEYTSGRIHSRGKGDFLYGRAEVRARLPAGQGTWPAIWMLPDDAFRYATRCSEGEDWHGKKGCDAWPNSGEIDIMEHVGYDMQTVWGTVHNKAYYWKNWQQRKAAVDGQNVDEDFHVYAIEWTPERIDIFFDGSPYFTYLNDGTGWESWPYDHPYHLILNLAIGGDWGRAGGPIDDSIFPVRMEVDYARVYQLTD